MLKKILCATTLLCAAGFVNAEVIVQESIVEVQSTDFGTVITLDKFDDMGGALILESVTFSIDGTIFGSAGVENLDDSPQVIETTLSASLRLTADDEDMTELVVTVPSVTNFFEASGFDESSDFGGSSGTTFDDLFAEQSASVTFTGSDLLDFFTGGYEDGTTNFSFDAFATSSAMSAGAFDSKFASEAGGIVRVTYDYRSTTVVSAPSHLAFLGLGLLVFVGMRKLTK